MIIGDRLRSLRVEKNLSQGDIEKRTGLLRCYISRVENGHTVPNIETLEKMARALEVPLHILFYDGDGPPILPKTVNRNGVGENYWGDSGKQNKTMNDFRRLLSQINEKDQRLLLCLANNMANRKASKLRRSAK